MYTLARQWTNIFFACCAFFSGALSASELMIFRTEANQQYYAKAGGNYTQIIEAWKGFATRQGFAAREVSLADLRKPQKNAVLLLPSAIVLTDAERRGIDAFAKVGGSLLSTWATGSRDEKGTWLGYEWLKQMHGAQVVADIRAESEERFLLPYGESITGGVLPAGKRMFLMKTVEPLLRATARYPIARYADWSRASHGPNADAAAIAVDEIQGSRRAWFGLPEVTWPSAQADMDVLIKGVISWLQRKPAMTMAAWPAPYKAAFYVEMDTEDKFENAATLERLFNERSLRGTFYMLTSLALKHPELVKRIATKHEIAYHADVHEGFKGLPAAQQEVRIKKMLQDMSQVIGDIGATSGFRAPLESYDKTTEQIIRKVGLRRHTAGPDSNDAALPTFSKAEPELTTDQALVILPRTMLDDINYVKMGLLAPGSVKKILEEALEDKIATRGLGLMSVHTQNFAPGGILDRELPVLLDAGVKHREDLWMPSGDQIERWWRLRERVSMLASYPVGKPAQIQLENTGTYTAPSVQVVLIPGANTPRLVNPPQGVRLVKQDDFRWALHINEIKPKTRINLSVQF